MATQELIEAREMRALYLAAEKHILGGQSYTIKDRTLTRANLSEVVKARKWWSAVVDSLTNGGSIRVRRVIPVDL